MKNKINVAELLKDCPEGMELDCTMYDTIFFYEITDDPVFPICIKRIDGAPITLTKYGEYANSPTAKCVIFPKGKTTWEGFQRPFMDGDVVCYLDSIAIFKEWGDATLFRTYVTAYLHGDSTIDVAIPLFGKSIRREARLASEEEKEKLFQAIKNNGYKWNEETKTLEKLIEPKFKIEKGKWYVCIKDLLDNYANKAFRKGDTYLSTQDGSLIPSNSNVPFEVVCPGTYFKDWTIQDAKECDVLAFNDEIIVIFKDLYNKTSFHSYCHIEDGIFTISKEDMPDWWEGIGFYPATQEQCNIFFQKIKAAGYEWNPETKTLEMLPKFKVGDRIILKDNPHNIPSIKIKAVTKSQYILENEGFFYISSADEKYVLEDKFDITTLKPFDKVLVRMDNKHVWSIQFFERLNTILKDSFVCMGGGRYHQCIPYEGNEHLLNKVVDCDEYFKTWDNGK